MKVVIVGGGFAGVKSALELSKVAGIEVQLISKGADFEYHGALYRSATGRSPLEVVLRLGKLFEGKNVDLVIDEITRINSSSKTIKSSTDRLYSYDILLLAIGNMPNYYGIEGLQRYSYTMYTIHDTTRLRSALVGLLSTEHLTNPRVVVVGGGATGVELAGEIQHFASMVGERYHCNVQRVEVDIVEGSDRLLPLLKPKASAIALKRLRKLGVNIFLNQKIQKVGQNFVQLQTENRAADILVWTAGSKIASIYENHPSIFSLINGKVDVDEWLRARGSQDIYVLGDNANTKYSGMAQTALHDAMFVSNHIKRLLKHQNTPAYKPRKPIYVVPIGPKWAVVQEGSRVRSGAYGWMIRRRADLYIFKNFQPVKDAIKTWRKGNRSANF